MPLVAPFKDGEFLQTASAQSMNKDSAETKNKSGIDSEAFLTLLVAEMQNQDPLEPTSNTEWISQYATFTQVSEIQEIGNDMSGMKAQGLVGEYVIMKVTDEKNGESNYVSGQVDYVLYEEGKAYLSINGEKYSIDDLDTVASKEYMEAYNLASDIVADVKKLPNIQGVTSSYKELITDLYDKVHDMNNYQKGFIDKEIFDVVDLYYNTLQVIMNGENAANTGDKAEDKAEEQAPVENVTNVTNNITNIYNTDSSADTDKADKDAVSDTNKAEESSNIQEADKKVEIEAEKTAAENTAEAKPEEDNTVKENITEDKIENVAENAVEKIADDIADNTANNAANNIVENPQEEVADSDTESSSDENGISEEIVDALTKDSES